MRFRVLSKLCIAGVLLASFLSAIVFFTQFGHGSRVITSALELNTGWKVIHPSSPMQTTDNWSGLFLEIPNSWIEPNKGSILPSNVSRSQIEGFLITNDDNIVPLNKQEVLTVGEGQYFLMTNEMFENNNKRYMIREVLLKSNQSVKAGNLVWVSYNPSSTKDGLPSLPK